MSAVLVFVSINLNWVSWNLPISYDLKDYAHGSYYMFYKIMSERILSQQLRRILINVCNVGLSLSCVQKTNFKLNKKLGSKNDYIGAHMLL